MMAAGRTYTPIATASVSNTTTAGLTFSSVPSTYTDLVLIFNGNADASGNGTRLRFNGDTASNYSDTALRGNGTTASSARETSTTNGFVITGYGYGSTVTLSEVTIVNIQNYANTTTYKTSLIRTGAAAGATSAAVGLWRSTSAINTLYVYAENGYLLNGSNATLYGIAAA
jgi:hypothetical protein